MWGVTGYVCLYSQARLDTLDSLDRMAELSQAEELKSKLLFSIIVVSTEYIRTKGVNEILWNTTFGVDAYLRDNLAKDVQSQFIRGPWLKQHNFHSKTYASNSKHHIYDRNMCPKHRDVNWMVYNRVIRFEMSPPEPFEICYFG